MLWEMNKEGPIGTGAPRLQPGLQTPAWLLGKVLDWDVPVVPV